AFREHGDTFARLSPLVGAEARLLLEPRPPGPDGRPVPYRCTSPPALADGIRVRQPGARTLPRSVAAANAHGVLARTSPDARAAAAIVSGVLDGTYPAVRAIAVHHEGALVLEEYFYGYDRARPHQMRSLTKSIVSLLAGAAVDRGLLRPDEPIIPRLGYATIAN